MEIVNTPKADEQSVQHLPDKATIGATVPTTEELFEAAEGVSISPTRAAIRRFMRDRRAVICSGILAFIIIFSFIFPLIYQHLGPTYLGGVTGKETIMPQDYHNPTWGELEQSDVAGTFLPLGPDSLKYPLGTDTTGHDIFAGLMAGVNVSIEVAILVEIVDIGLGVLLGTLAAWYGGWLGAVLDRFTDIMFAFPGLLLILLIAATLGPQFDMVFHTSLLGRILLLTFAIGLLAWPLMMRYVRGQSLLLKEQQYVEAARTVGTPNIRIIWRHLVPNLLNVVVVAATLDILTTIIGEAGISFLGAGIRPPNTSLGLMISNAANKLETNWTEMLWPCVVLVVLVLSFSFIGDGVRDAFDPRTKD
ncbi:MAG TPA: ABC transporter permease [Ktedonobacterales bacterium]|nr:ABC transporter permease [Ktedonobacterales bacterium]